MGGTTAPSAARRAATLGHDVAPMRKVRAIITNLLLAVAYKDRGEATRRSRRRDEGGKAGRPLLRG